MARNPGTPLEEWITEALSSLYQDATRTKASGSVWNSGDVIAGPLEIETKDRPNSKSISVSQTVIRKIRKSALKSGRIPVVVTKCLEGTYVTLDWVSFFGFLKEIESLNSLIDKQDQKDQLNE